ncbi:hypothetical protein B1A99_26445 [Cohnella sp. CIP 111063]|uniref:beta-galactosidase n=1 Tax=unclassified Cohnella TaxID=2636738 RepID=UPI000B8BF06D|nr:MULTISPECIES: beta-galactosidase [unclassified Cohnella]OXS54492.1 hypothetical protein B1A99_26445 [Cohnella sp. CIP 111063]PRX63994.1 beta-galactosidase [Cohnella sp. SGD-V74]
MAADKRLRTNRYLLGVCYYPEHWRRELWDDDFRRMRELGFNTVRMGESAWPIFEPEEGRYSFELFDEAIALCKRHGLDVILGTPTYAPPAWLTAKYPEALRRDFHGQVMHHGSRRHCNYTAAAYLERCAAIVERMALHYRDEPAVIGWQIDNELNCHMDVSFADSDRAAFREWCRRKYGSLERLNEAWGTVFWAQTYSDWAQVDLPRPTPTYHNPGHLLDFYRFTSDSAIAFAKLQYDALKRHAPHRFATHNGLFGNIDNPELTERALDFMSFDSYPAFQLMRGDLPAHYRDRMTSKHLGRVRGMSGKFMILEQQAGPGGQSGNTLNRYGFGDYLQATPKPGQLRLWAWQSAAHGADGLLFFRWRTVTAGAETLWHGLNDYGNRPNRRVEEAGRFADDIAKLGDLLVGSEIVPETALLYDYDNDSNAKIEGYIGPFEWESEESLFRGLTELHLNADQLSLRPMRDPERLRPYKALFYPNAQLLAEEDVALLRRYAEEGGIIVFGPRAGYKDRTNRCYSLPFPGVLRELTGTEAAEFTMVRDTSSTMTYASSGVSAAAPHFNEILRPFSPEAEVLARYDADYYRGEPAIVATRVGRGRVVYCGAFFTDANVPELLSALGLADPLADWARIPREVETVRRRSGTDEFYIFLNYTAEPQKLVFLSPGETLPDGSPLLGEVALPPYDVLVARRARR